MIFVLEMPAGTDPRAWFAFDVDDLVRKVTANDPLEAWEIWDQASARELLDLFDLRPEQAEAAVACPGICALGQEHGWDAPLYRADHLLGRGTYSAEPVNEAQACVAALEARGPCRVWWHEAEAVLAMERDDDPLWAGPGWKARWALREQLLATEVLADN